MATATLGTPENKIEAIYAKKIYADSYNGIPIGIPLPMPTNGEVPAGFVEYNGASLSRAMYPDLFAFLGTAYGAEDELHFNVPDMRGKFWQGDDVAGITKEAGLPNIEGRFDSQYLDDKDMPASGAFGKDVDTLGGQRAASGSSTVQNGNFTFDASRSSSIYGSSDTVQPPAITCRWIARAFDTATPDSALVDMTQVANELNGKANRDLSNVNINNIGTAKIIDAVFPDYSAGISFSTTPPNNIVPIDGYIYDTNLTILDGHNEIYINDILVFKQSDDASGGNSQSLTSLMVRKNDVVRIVGNYAGGTLTIFPVKGVE